MKKKLKKKISIITGVLNEEAIVEDIVKAISNEMKKLSKKYDYEHIFMDNCSTDGTLQILKSLAKKDKHIKILAYSRNFGPEKSGFTGLINADGDAILPYEGNMKDPVSLIPTLLRHWEDGNELVLAVRKSTKESWLMQWSRKVFYRLVNALSVEDLPRGYGSFGVIDKKIIDELKKIEDYKPYTRGLLATMGFKQKKVFYERKARPKGKGRSKSSIAYLIDYAINGLISYSIFPIRFMTYVGLGLSSMSFLGAIVYLILKIFYWKVTVPGITGAIFLILFFSGIQLFFIGIIGEYVGAIHSQVRKKPFVVIKERINF